MLAVVADHVDGGVVWGGAAAFGQGFFDELGAERVTIQAVSIDMSGGHEKAGGRRFPGPGSPGRSARSFGPS